jgi:hypothetical protein
MAEKYYKLAVLCCCRVKRASRYNSSNQPTSQPASIATNSLPSHQFNCENIESRWLHDKTLDHINSGAAERGECDGARWWQILASEFSRPKFQIQKNITDLKWPYTLSAREISAAVESSVIEIFDCVVTVIHIIHMYLICPNKLYK